MSNLSEPSNHLSREIQAHYGSGYEAQRLSRGTSQLERARTEELIKRYLPPTPAVIFDVGGGSGVYACWLAREGYEVHLVDAMPLHVEKARQASDEQPGHTLASINLGDARELNRVEASVDAVLLCGPLYHLTEREDRIRALREARRILRPGGVLLAACISRFASALDGLFQRFMDDPEFQRIVWRDLAEGQHRNPANHPAYFTTAFFHHPDKIKAEVEEAGLHHESTLAIEGPGWLLQDFEDHWNDDGRRKRLLDIVRALESEPTLLGASAHLMAVARKDS
jgi:ubiquinone/menaquinone biosynthesis C-methylase UbiE